ncbi:protein argonaute-4-like isoform X2 [Stegodyphus dumicola]|uniref:protein argonaute-4-like isoform X2 n=1 Tax=Stegodyphus dumicola TaxID=202533 RepID=UPI0015A97805|nr:protein argonaute-4-like isoform X2 [Stegodyphus dumicola]
MPRKRKGKGRDPTQQTLQQQTPVEEAASSQEQAAAKKEFQEEERDRPSVPPARLLKAANSGQDETVLQKQTRNRDRHVFSNQEHLHSSCEISEPEEKKPEFTRDETGKNFQTEGEERYSENLFEKISGLSLQSKEMQVSKKEYSMATRPGYGIKGRNIKLIANYFILKFKDMPIYHYDVNITQNTKEGESKESIIHQGNTLKQAKEKGVPVVEHEQKRNICKEKCRKIFATLVKNKRLQKFCPVYDGQKNIFTNQILPFHKELCENIDIGEKNTFCVIIKPVRKEDGSNLINLEPLMELYRGRSREIPQDALLVFDTVMNHREPPLIQVQLRNSFFSPNQNDSRNLLSGLEIWFGYNQSVHLAQNFPVVVVNLAAKAFHKYGSVIDYACEILRINIINWPRLEPLQIQELSDALRNVRVRVTHQKQPRLYTIKGVRNLPAREEMMEFEKRKISVAQYFAQKYKTLCYPQLPCLHMHGGNNKTYMPMENCVIVKGQAKIGKLSAETTSRMITNTAIEPEDRFQKIMKHSRTIQNVSGPVMNHFGLEMDSQFMRLTGRIIPAPSLAYSGNAPSRIAKPDRKGVWRIETGKEFYKAMKVQKWIVISFVKEKFCGFGKLRYYSETLVTSSIKCGMNLPHPCEIKLFDDRSSTEEAILYAKRSGAEFAIIVLSRNDKKHSYEEVKYLADIKYNLVTQCMDDKSLRKINDQITTNVCLKINIKLGGINHIFLQNPPTFSSSVIVFGADCVHWPRDFGYPSIAAVVGSLDKTVSRYALKCVLQENKDDSKLSQEIITEMKSVVKGILEVFSENNGGEKPEKILFFRDGVSEGQLKSALEEEVTGIQQACSELFHKTLPITYIVVQKRHQTRVRPQDRQEGVYKSGNVPPGTTIDTTITHPVFFDFFLCSHEGIHGTSKPAHYIVLHDDNQFTADDLQHLCHSLCYAYTRCTRGVSIPAPVLYADLAANRAKKYADRFAESKSGKTRQPLPLEVVQAIENMHDMFYI